MERIAAGEERIEKLLRAFRERLASYGMEEDELSSYISVHALFESRYRRIIAILTLYIAPVVNSL